MTVPLILVIEEQRPVREMLCRVFQSSLPGAEVIAINDACQSLRLAKQLPVSLVVVDYQLQSHCAELLSWLHGAAASGGRPAPAVVMTASRPDQVFGCDRQMADLWLRKPPTRDDVVTLVTPLLRRGASQPELRAYQRGL